MQSLAAEEGKFTQARPTVCSAAVSLRGERVEGSAMHMLGARDVRDVQKNRVTYSGAVSSCEKGTEWRNKLQTLGGRRQIHPDELDRGNGKW